MYITKASAPWNASQKDARTAERWMCAVLARALLSDS